MRLLFFCLLSCCLFLATGLAARADGWSLKDFGNPMDSCPKDLPSATVRIALSLYDPPVYQNYSIPEPSHFPTRTSPYASDAIVHTYGLTRNPLRFLAKSEITGVVNKLTRKKCFWYKSIDLTLEVKPEIFMGKEIKQGTCYYNAVLHHELQHANIERKLLQDYQPIITQTLAQFVTNVGFMRDIDASQPDDVTYNKFQQLLDQQMDVIHAHMEPVREARQAEIDTKASYEATAAPCRAIEPPPY